MLKVLLEDFDRSFIIIDVLDENPANYEDLLLQLRSLSKMPSLKILVTSRDGEQGHLHHAMKDLKTLHPPILPKNHEIHSYVVPRLNRSKDRDEDQYGLGSALVEILSSDNERDEIEEKIVEAASGNFLCAQLHITMLRHETNAGTVKKRSNNLP